jgi:hypothetical protein
MENDLGYHNHGKNLNMFDDPEEIDTTKELCLTTNSKILDDNTVKFSPTKCKKSTKIKVNDLSHDKNEIIQIHENTNYLKILKPKATIDILSKQNSLGEQNNYCENSMHSPQVLYNKENFLIRDDITSNLKQFSSPRLIMNDSNRSSKYANEKSYDIDAKLNMDLKEKKMTLQII